MYNVIDFVNWLKTHTENGAEPWVYLMGTSGHKVTEALLNAKFDSFYHKKMSREWYDYYTAGWAEQGRIAADCQGLADAYCTQVLGVPTEITSNANYTDWCSHKGSVKKIDRPYVLGEAVFMAHANGHVHHVGFVCDFDTDGEPLVIEARGIAYGVVTTRLCDREWTHRGLMTKIFRYEGVEDMKTIFKLENPMMKGKAVKALQKMLNAAGYPDSAGNSLDIDGKLGKKTYSAFSGFLQAHRALIGEPTAESIVVTQEIGTDVYTGELIRRK